MEEVGGWDLKVQLILFDFKIYEWLLKNRESREPPFLGSRPSSYFTVKSPCLSFATVAPQAAPLSKQQFLVYCLFRYSWFVKKGEHLLGNATPFASMALSV